MIKFTGIIPVRYQSSRLPGKPLADINGKSMLQRVWERVQLSKRCGRLIIATDHPEIERHARQLGAEVVMTREDHRSGTDRVAEAATKMNVDKSSVVINIQGDEPFLDPEHPDMLCAAFEEEETQIATLAISLKDSAMYDNPSAVKVVKDLSNWAMYFSRAAIPHYRDAVEEVAYLRHIGVYAFRNEVLQKVSTLSCSTLEQAEKLEQLRWMEHGHRIRVIQTEKDTITVDTPEDLEAAIEFAKTQD